MAHDAASSARGISRDARSYSRSSTSVLSSTYLQS